MFQASSLLKRITGRKSKNILRGVGKKYLEGGTSRKWEGREKGDFYSENVGPRQVPYKHKIGGARLSRW